MKKVCVFAIVCLIGNLAAAQKFELVLDKNFYVLGETMWYSVFSPESDTTHLVYANLFAPDGSVVDYQKLMLENGQADGAIRIPLSAQAGWHTLQTYFLDFSGRPVVYHEQHIPIYNDFEPPQLTPNVDIMPEPFTNTSSVQLRFGKQTYKPREQIKVTVQLPEAGQFAVRVLPKAQTAPIRKFAYQDSRAFQEADTLETFVPLRGFLFRPRSDRPVTTNLLAAYLIETQEFFWSSTNAKGYFEFRLPNFRGERHIQFVDFEGQNFEVDLLRPYAQPPVTKPSITELPGTPEVLNYLELSRKRKNIQRLFDLSETATSTAILDSTFLQPDRSYRPENFIALPTVREFLKEAIPDIKMRNDGELWLFHRDAQRFRAAPLLLLNNRLIASEQTYFDLDMDNIKSVDVFMFPETLESQFDALGRNGVVAVYTKDGSLKAEDLAGYSTIKGLAAKPAFLPTDLSEEVPDFRSVIYWNPAVQTDADGQANFSFPHSDDVGAFQLQLSGYLENGKWVEFVAEYEVN